MKLLTPILLIIYVFACLPIRGQGYNVFYKWDLSLSYSYEKHDQRLFDFPGKKNLLEFTEDQGEWGTYWIGVNAQRNILENDYNQFYIGFGIARETQTFKRPFRKSQLYPNSTFYNSFLQFTNRYKIWHLQIPVTYFFKFSDNISVGAKSFTNINFYKNAAFKSKNHSSNNKNNGNFLIDFYSFSVFPTIKVSKDRFALDLSYRLYRIKKIDRVIFNSLLFTSKTQSKSIVSDEFESYNPMHIRLGVSYSLYPRE